jgi:hypothetical protein
MGILTGVEMWEIKTGREIINENAMIIDEVGAPHDVFGVKIAQGDKRGI